MLAVQIESSELKCVTVFVLLFQNWAGLATGPTAGMMVVFVSAPPRV
jgi:hypothetical protein